MSNNIIWQFILNYLENGKKVTLLIVAESSNSSPGRQGFKMAVAEDAEVYGTIGGGIMEKDMMEFALEFLFSEEHTAIKRLHHSSTTKFEKSGLICGGRQTIIFKKLEQHHQPLIEKIIYNAHNRITGGLIVSASQFEYGEGASTVDIEFDDKGETWEYREQIGVTNTAYIVGGGHIGLAVSRIMKSIGFYVVVFDHREDVFTLEQNEYADEIIICNYEEIGGKVRRGNKSYVIIATPMHAGDTAALKSVINKNVKYIGLMGSKRKIKTIFDVLRDEGIDENLFDKVFTPIGIEIEAETPEEIAVSIAAEIIKVKNRVNAD